MADACLAHPANPTLLLTRHRCSVSPIRPVSRLPSQAHGGPGGWSSLVQKDSRQAWQERGEAPLSWPTPPGIHLAKQSRTQLQPSYMPADTVTHFLLRDHAQTRSACLRGKRSGVLLQSFPFIWSQEKMWNLAWMHTEGSKTKSPWKKSPPDSANDCDRRQQKDNTVIVTCKKNACSASEPPWALRKNVDSPA